MLLTSSCTCHRYCRNCEASLRKRSQAAQSKKDKQLEDLEDGDEAPAAPAGAFAAAAPVQRAAQQQQQALWKLFNTLDGAALLDDPNLLQSEDSEMLFFELEQHAGHQQLAGDQGFAGFLNSWLSDDLDECTTSCPDAALLAPAAHVPSSSTAAAAAAAEAAAGRVPAAARHVTLPNSPMSSTSDAAAAAAAAAAALAFPFVGSPSSIVAGFSSPQLAGVSAFSLHPQHPQQGLQAAQLEHLQHLELQALQEKHYMQRLMLQQQSDTRHLARAPRTGGPIAMPLLMPEHVSLPPRQQQQVLLRPPQLAAAVNTAGQVLHSYHAYPQLPGSAASSYYGPAAILACMPADTGLGAGHMQPMQRSLPAAHVQLSVSPSGGAAYELGRQNSSNTANQSSRQGRSPTASQGQQAGASPAGWSPAMLP
jgi:hypothetical protein